MLGLASLGPCKPIGSLSFIGPFMATFFILLNPTSLNNDLHISSTRLSSLGFMYKQEYISLSRSETLSLRLSLFDADNNFLGSDNFTPISPTNFLHKLWSTSKHLAGYHEHDAHELLMAVLNRLHEEVRIHSSNSLECRCIIHQTFSGMLKSEVTCEACNSTTSASLGRNFSTSNFE
ncbi:hypothetical protein CONCODRAFT_9145 [Conidiobolus coronatus NRRL 28638]|uniref:USP domain-containing protein n=1 Tax=Conidiobolus coronatus (strain ATCC 28846 / CBS 209.66 / NRRL 28638) TaxID=796925 RepID=A0A137P0N4_CONC2|nr:hypothetical protein CONCODRAFT_9145 [Conidiobolus coronatus NRRL 28638]|eukprot:KXN68552.1 hypothetical protein CONCODRAFT_9145 [Conidiobolus coronatus NRRL 28638]